MYKGRCKYVQMEAVRKRYRALADKAQKQEANTLGMLRHYQEQDVTRMEHRHEIHSARLSASHSYSVSDRVRHALILTCCPLICSGHFF